VPLELALFFFLFWVTGELSTLRQLMKVPNEPGLSPNNGLENVSVSDQSMAGAGLHGSYPLDLHGVQGLRTSSKEAKVSNQKKHRAENGKARRLVGPSRRN